MVWSQFTVDEWRSCVDGVVTVDEWRSCVDDVVTVHSGWCGHSSQWMNGGVVWMVWSQFTVDEWRSCVDGVVTVHSG